MKQTFSIILLLFLFTETINAQKSIIDKYCDLDNVTCICISKDMLNLISSDNIYIPVDIELDKIINKLDGLQILTTQSPSAIKKITSETVFSETNGYIELIRIKDNSEKVLIYQKKVRENRNEFILLTTEKNKNNKDEELTIIVLTGTVSIREIQQMICN